MKDALRGEFDGLELGDERLNERARRTLAALSIEPAAGAPTVLSEAELEGYYRFVNNVRVSFRALLGAHVDATVRRAAGAERLVVAHDSTDFRFSDEVPRSGLGPMDNGGQGFYAHVSLAVGSMRQALGVVGVETWTRASRHSAKKTQEEAYANPDKESLRWMRAVHDTERIFGSARKLVHVMDREADDYDILAELIANRFDFVVRASHDRRLATNDGGLKTFARELDVRCERHAELSSRRTKRPAKQRKTNPPRAARSTLLAFSAHSIKIRRPKRSRAAATELALNVVHVHEPTPPAGSEPVEWFLLTTEAIDTEEQILQIVDDYRARWVVEEFFKALKTGCAYEKRQHESKVALLNVLGVFIPIAWSLLNMRTLSRDEQSAIRPAAEVFSATQLQILSIHSKNRLSPHPTIREAVLLMARTLGGLQRGNGEPGWQVLGRAFEKLLTLDAGWRLAAAHLGAAARRSDL